MTEAGVPLASGIEHLTPHLAGGALDPDGLDGLVGLRLRLAQASVQRGLLTLLAPLGVTQKQVAVLWLVAANPGVSQIQLATALDMDAATMMSIVVRLAKRGLVARGRSKADRRRQALELTAAGGELLCEAKRLVDEHERRIVAALGPDLAAFLAALTRLRGGTGD